MSETTFTIKQVSVTGRWVPSALSSRPHEKAWHCDLCTDELTVFRLTAAAPNVPSESNGWMAHSCQGCGRAYHDTCLQAYASSTGKEFGCASCGGKTNVYNPVALDQ